MDGTAPGRNLISVNPGLTTPMYCVVSLIEAERTDPGFAKVEFASHLEFHGC